MNKRIGDSSYFYEWVILTSYIKPAFSTIWLGEILKIYLEKEVMIKYFVIKHLILLKIQNVMDIRVNLYQWFTSFLIKVCWYFYSHCDLNQFWKTTISRETTQANNIWCFDPADIQLISKYRKNNLILLKIWLFWSTFYICISDIFVNVLNIKTTNALQNILNETSLKTRKYGKIKMVNFPIDQ